MSTLPHQHLRRRLRGYTMTEILVVIGIIVLMLAIGVPAFNMIRGGRSLDAAENQIAAMLGRARADAIGLQKMHGIMFVLDRQGDLEPNNDRVYVIEVAEADYPIGPTPPAGDRDVYLDATDIEFIPLPVGVTVQTLNESNASLGVTDRYLGFNKQITGPGGGPDTLAGRWFGGVILFNGRGQVVNRTYGLRTALDNGKFTRMGTEVLGYASPDFYYKPGRAPAKAAAANNTAPSSAFGIVLMDMQQFLANGNNEDPQVEDGINPGETGEESWIDSNAIPLMVNRYNGSLVRGTQ